MSDSLSKAQRFFYRYGTSRALFLWLHFRHFLTGPDWLSTMKSTQPAAVSDLLTHWNEQSKTPEIHPFVWLGLKLCALLFGGSAMITALSYAGTAPVNLWLVLGLFAVLPLLMTLLSSLTIALQRGRPPAQWPAIQRLVLKTMRIPEEWLRFNRLISNWALWQAQSIALLVSVGSLAGFMLVALFRDVAFGWSSTLITEAKTMQTIFQVLTLPWSWWLPLPPEEAIVGSHYFQNIPLSNPAAGRLWWPTVVMAVLVYGILPRVFLQQWLRFRFARALKDDIRGSGEIERFVNSCQRAASLTPAQAPEVSQQTAGFKCISLDTDQYRFVAWQLPFEHPAICFQFGAASWQADVDWIQQTANQFDRPIQIIAQVWQTPTGELADCIHLLQQQGNEVAISLAGLQQDQKQHPPADGAYRSWQYFAEQHALPLYQLEEASHDRA